MPPKRSKDQINAQILALCQEDGATKTRIVYQVGLNFGTVRPYLARLTEKSYLEIVQSDRTTYRTTEKGKKAMRCLVRIEEIYS